MAITSFLPFVQSPSAAASELIAAVDVGTSRVACAVAELGPDGPKVLAVESAASFGIRGGEIVDLKRASEAIQIAIAAASDQADADVKTVVAGLSGDVKLSFTKAAMELDREHRTVTAPDVARLRNCLVGECGPGRRVIHRFDGPYSLGDLQGLERPEGLLGDRLEMQAAFLSMAADRLDNLLRAVRAAHVEIEAVSLEPLSCSLGAMSEDERRLGAAVLDFGAGAFRGALWEGGRLRQICVLGRENGKVQSQSGHYLAPVGGMEGVVMALARRFRIAPATAERLLKSHGALGEEGTIDKTLPESVEVAAVDGLGSVRVETKELSLTLEEVLTPVARALREGLSGFSSGHSVGVVLTGGGAHIQGLPAWLAKRFGGAPVRLGAPRWELPEETALAPEISGATACSLYGLLLFGAQGRADLRCRLATSFLGRVSGLLRRLVASF